MFRLQVAWRSTRLGTRARPPDFDGEGTARLEGGALVLGALWLGTANHETETAACAQRFRR